MSERTSSKPGIADYVVARRKRKECFLDEIDRLIASSPHRLEDGFPGPAVETLNRVGGVNQPPHCFWIIEK